MKIKVINKELQPIIRFELESNPFKVGETISINIYNKNTYGEDAMVGEFIIDKIAHVFEKDYIEVRRVSSEFTVLVTVIRIK